MLSNDHSWLVWTFVGTLVVVGLLLTIQEANDWAEFKEAHHCKVVGKIKGDISYGIGSDGKSTTIINPDKTAWQCDDGVTYWR